MLHEKICDSVTLAELTGDEERLFHRLVVKADDYGRFHAHPSLLLGACFPLLIAKVTIEQVEAWRDRLAEVGLIALYVVEGREYLQLVTWDSYQRQRGSKSKFPDPPQFAASCGGSPRVADKTDAPATESAALPDTESGFAATCGELRRVAASCGSRVVKTGFPEDVDVDDRRRRSPPTPPPSGRGNGAAAPGKGRTTSTDRVNGVAPRPPARPPPKLEPGEEWIEPGHPDYSPLVGRYKRVRV